MILADRRKRVTGEKLYARDLRPHDLGWVPEETPLLHAHLLRATHVDRPFAGLDLALLKEIAPGPRDPVTAKDLLRDRVRNPDRWSSSFGRLLVNEGERAEMYGQPLALLFFKHVRDIQDFLEDPRSSSVVRYADPDPHLLRSLERPRYSSYHLVRIAGGEETKPHEEFSALKNGAHDPTELSPDLKEEVRARNKAAREAVRRIEQDIAAHLKAGAEDPWHCLERTFSTPSADPMFMEPEAGIGWWTGADRILRLAVGTQSPGKDASNVKELLKSSSFLEGGQLPLEVELKACPPGGGFGGRDDSSFPLYLALAALYAGAPVRLAFSRSEQFLSGIKRHAASVKSRLCYSPATGALRALQSEIAMDGGGQLNLTVPVLQLSVLHAAGPYRIPRTALHGTALVSPAAPAGSMRGFGIPQVTFAIESMIDEVATGLGGCPIEYRLGRLLRTGDRDVSGMPLDHHLANEAICREALKDPLWRDRAKAKRERDRQGVAYGVGFACCMEAYGTSRDAAFAGVELSAGGAVSVCSSAIDMGQGATAALSAATAPLLGAEAAEVTLGDLKLFDVLELITRSESKGDERYTPKDSNSMSASMTAFFHLHAVEEACRVVFEHGLLPAAFALWGQRPGATRWEDGQLKAEGLRPLPLQELAARVHRDRYVSGARVHTFFQHHHATALFRGLDGEGRWRPIDGLAVRRGGDGYQRVKRDAVALPEGPERQYKRTLYASVGHLLGVEVHLGTGRVRVVEAATVLDAGDVHHYALLEGQVQGGLAMGIGMALSEELPPAPASMDPSWNLNRYIVPRVTDVPPLEKMRLALVGLDSERGILGPGGAAPLPPMRKKGIAEAAMTTVAPAISNAIAHATGLRLRQAPFTSTRVREALAAR